MTPHRERRWIVVLLLASACLDLYRLGAPALFDQDESEYAQIAVEMVQTGDPVTLHVNGHPWFVHPPLYMWLVAATGRALGFSEWTVRIWSVLFSLLAVYATVLLGRALFDGRVGLIAGAILAVTLQFLGQSRLAVFDTVLLAWMLLAFHAFLQGYRSGRRADYLRCFLFAGLATLTKGPIGALLPGLVIVAFVTLRRGWARWREVPWGAGVAVYAIVGLSWYAAETVRHGGAFLVSNVGYYMVGRFFGVVEKHSAPWYFYLPVAALGGLPWTAFWPDAARLHLRQWRSADGSLVVLLWTAIPVLFYTAAQTKLPGYIMPIFPFAAIGVAAFWGPILERGGADPRVTRALGWLLGFVVVLLGAAWAVLGALYPGPLRAAGGDLLLTAATLVVGLAAALVAGRRGSSRAAFALVCATMAATWVAVLTWVLPLAEAQKPIRPLASAIDATLRPGDRIVAYRMNTATSLIYYTGHRVEWAEMPGELRRDLCAPGRVFLVITRDELARLPWEPPPLEPVAQRVGTLVLEKPAALRCAASSGRIGPRYVVSAWLPSSRPASERRPPSPANARKTPS